VTQLKYRLLGRSGLRVAQLALGTMTFGLRDDWGTDAAEARRIYEAYREAGGNYIDTANQYAGGASEEIIGQLVAGHREEVVMASKYTNSAPGRGANAGGGQRKNMMESVEQSLRRLGTDYIDLYIAHAWDQFTPAEEVMRAFDDLVRAGKVLYIGVSNTPAWVVSKANTLAELRGWTRYAGLQIEYSLLARDPERELAPMAADQEMTIIAWSPLKNGLLTGKYLQGQRQRSEAGRLDGKYFRSALLAPVSQAGDQAADTVREVIAVAAEIGAEPAQVSLAWLMHRPQPVIPIMGARTLGQFRQNLPAADVILTAGQLSRLDTVSQVGLGFPHDYLNGDLSRSFRTGGLHARIIPRGAAGR
jgi:aryl-alcohol dehydrogenase-like predicted oxidoreductase